MKIRKFQNEGIIQRRDGTIVNKPIVTNIPLDDSLESKFYQDLLKISPTDETNQYYDFLQKAHNTGTVKPYDYKAHHGYIKVDSKTGDITDREAPTTISAAPPSKWQSPAFQALISIPLMEIPYIVGNLSSKLRIPITKRIYKSPTIDVSKVDNDINTEFILKYPIDHLPGHHVKALMRNNPLEQTIVSNGNIPRQVLEDYVATTSPMEQDLMSRVLKTPQFEDLDIIDYNTFRKAAQDALPKIYDDQLGFYIIDDIGNVGLAKPHTILSVPNAEGIWFSRLFNPSYPDDRSKIIASKFREARIRAALKSLPKPTNGQRLKYEFNVTDEKLTPEALEYLNLEKELSNLRRYEGGLDYLQLKHFNDNYYDIMLHNILRNPRIINNPWYGRPTIVIDNPGLIEAAEKDIRIPTSKFIRKSWDKKKETPSLKINVPEGYEKWELEFKKGGKI